MAIILAYRFAIVILDGAGRSVLTVFTQGRSILFEGTVMGRIVSDKPSPFAP